MTIQHIGDLPEEVVLCFSPGYCCWHCEKLLPPAFSAVYAVAAKGTVSRRCLFLTCIPACQTHVLRESLQCGVAAEPWSPMKVRQFLDCPEKIGGIAVSTFPLLRDRSLRSGVGD